jgi:hypothetical protein
MNRSDSLAKLAPALLKAQRNMGVALKDSKNPFFKSNFANLNSVIDASVPVLNEQGIVVLQTPTTVGLDSSLGAKYVLQTILLHESGEYITSETDIVAGKANDPQALGSAISYARRYGLQSTVTLKAEDDDSESNYNRTPKSVVGTASKTTDTSVTGSTNAASLTSATQTAVVATPAPFKRTRPTSTKTTGGDIL